MAFLYESDLDALIAKSEVFENESRVVVVVGGTGYIGSHTVVQLLQKGHSVVVIDNLSNSTDKVIPRIHAITEPNTIEAFYNIDLTDKSLISDILSIYDGRIHCVIHFAGLKAVGESVSKPLDYYHNNVTGTVNLLMAMKECGAFNIIFSSSACVYGEPETLPLTETATTNATNPYGKTKLMIEDIIRDTCKTDERWSAVILRYFNPVGAHPSGKIGEVTNGVPNNLMPYVAQVCTGKRPFLRVFGNDYPTKDGTGLRDYLHIEDLAAGHIAALEYMDNNSKCDCKIFNLGTGKGYTVLEVVEAMKQASNKDIPLQYEERRAGDVASCWSDPTLAKQELNWEATKDLKQMCQDLWNFQSQNPDGY